MDPVSPLSKKQKCLWLSVLGLPHYMHVSQWKVWLISVNRFFQTVHLKDSTFFFFQLSCINGKYCNFICQFITVINRGIWIYSKKIRSLLTGSLIETELVWQRRFSVQWVIIAQFCRTDSSHRNDSFGQTLTIHQLSLNNSSWPQDKSWRKCIEIVNN